MEPALPTSLKRLEWSVRALAQAAEVQRGLFPEFVCVPDELALEFEEQWQNVLAGQPSLSTELRRALETLDQLLERMSGPGLDAWTDEALRTAPEWSKVRESALRVLASANWSTAPPPVARGAIYVGPDN